MLEALIDCIYEAAGTPKLWEGVVQGLSTHADADRSVLTVLSPGGPARWIASPAPKDRSADSIDPFAHTHTGRDTQWPSLASSKFVPDIESVLTGRSGEPYGDGERPWQIGTAIQLPTGDLAVLTLERRAERGRFATSILSNLDTLRPHLVRACHLSAQFGCERARVTTTALDRVGLPAAVMTSSGRILAINDRLHGRQQTLSLGQNIELLFRKFANGKALCEAIKGVSDGSRASISVPVRTCADHRQFIVYICRMERNRSDIFDASAMQCVLNRVGARPAPDNDLLHLLYDLTPAEARLLRALASGLRLQFYAESIGVQASTARSQLKSIFHKTGTTRQAELLSLIASISAFNGGVTNSRETARVAPAHCTQIL